MTSFRVLARSVCLVSLLALSGIVRADEPKQATDAPKGPADWKVEVLHEQPTVNYCSVVACAPDGRIFLAEDPMDMVGPPNKPIDRILCIHPNGKITTYAENLYAVFGLVYMDGKLYVHHCPKFSVFEDGGDVGRNRVDIIDQTHPQPWGGMNDHIPANVRLGMDGWFYMAVGDKGIFGAVGKDGSKAEIVGGGILRFRPDGTKLEVFSSGTRNHLDMAINAEDEMFTYDNTDDGGGWWTRVTHMVDGGFYGYPYDYKPRRPYTLWMMKDYAGGSPTGALAYNEDALPKEYHGNLFMCEWGKSELARFIVERDGGSYKIVRRDAFLKKGAKEFRPVGVAVFPDGMSIYIADWNFAGWSSKTAKAGRLVKATYLGKSEAAPKPAWLVPAAQGQKFTATTEELVQALSHPAQSVRLVAMRRVAERGAEAVPLLEKLVRDSKAAAVGRWSAIWTLDLMKVGRAAIVAALGDADPSVRRQAARQLGTAQASDAVTPLVKLLKEEDKSVRFHAATALGRIGEATAVADLIGLLDESDLFTRYAAFTALHRIGMAEPKAWRGITAAFASDRTPVREAGLFAFRDAHSVEAIKALADAATNAKLSGEVRGQALETIGDLALKRPAWKGQWWGIGPANGKPPARSVAWDGTDSVFAALRAGLLDSDVNVRQGAARGIMGSHSPLLAVELIQHVSGEKDALTRKAVLMALCEIRNPDPAFKKAAGALVVDTVSKGAGAEVGELIKLAAIIGTQTPELTAAFMNLSTQKLPEEQQILVLETLGRSNSDKAAAVLAARAQAGDDAVRAAAIKLLVPVKGEVATATLVGLLKDNAPSIRRESAIALGKRRDKAAIPALLAVLEDKEVRFDAITALAQTPDARALAAYIDGMASKNTQQRNACTDAIKALKADALPVIEERLKQAPPLPAHTILHLQKLYSGDAATRKSPLFSVAAKTISVADFSASALQENGKTERGRTLFMDIKGAACIKCHRVGKEGGDVGPDLSGIGAKYNRQKLAESVLEPSKQILDGYETTIVETKNGQIIQGIVRADTGDELTLNDAEGKKIVLKKGNIESRVKSKQSIMPDGLHIGMTINEVADLLSYLESLREKVAAPTKK